MSEVLTRDDPEESPSAGPAPDTTLLGPQRKRPTASRLARDLEGPIATITAGWQENENDPLPRGLNGRSAKLPAENLGIYRRAEQVFDEDRELFQAHRERQRRLKRLQRVYRVRLDHVVAAYRELAELAREDDSTSIAEEAAAALESVRDLDRHHLERVRSVHAEFEERWPVGSRPVVARHREELARQLESAATVVIAGGHVAVLLNRLRLFDLAPLLAGKAVFAWSAGAMVAARRIVLFHDNPPWGAGNAEVLDLGLGLFDGLLPLPDVRRRLRSDDPRRVSLLASRFAPYVCVGLDETSILRRGTDGWRGRHALRFGADGRARRLGWSAWEDLGLEPAAPNHDAPRDRERSADPATPSDEGDER